MYVGNFLDKGKQQAIDALLVSVPDFLSATTTSYD